MDQRYRTWDERYFFEAEGRPRSGGREKALALLIQSTQNEHTRTVHSQAGELIPAIRGARNQVPPPPRQLPARVVGWPSRRSLPLPGHFITPGVASVPGWRIGAGFASAGTRKRWPAPF